MKRHASRREVTITRLATGGEGVGHIDVHGETRAVFVAKAAPGDVVTCDVDMMSRPAYGRLVALVSAGPGRRDVACAHFDRCGGCDFLHLSPEVQLRAHEDRVASALRELPHPKPTVHPYPGGERERTRARVHVEGDKRGRVVAGFFEERSRDLVAIERCIALRAEIERARAALPSLLASAVGRGEALLALGAFETPRRAVLSLSFNHTLPAVVFARAEALVRDGVLAGARILERGAARAVTIGDPTPHTRGADGEPLALAPGGFAQATEHPLLAEVVLARAKEALAGRASPRIVELYAGAGNFSVALARLGALSTWESNADACEKARENLRARGQRASVTNADAETFATKERPDLVLLDPPREGARAVAEKLTREQPRAIVYVSCDPETLARDAKILATSYSLTSLDVVPCFPDTSHVECVLVLTRARK